jgi:hypothetical protein
MKLSTFLLSLILILAASACSPGGKINGHTTRTALRSVKMLRNRLPQEEKIAFEMSFWAIRQNIQNTDDFLATVDGKTPVQIIEQGKQLFAEQKATGYAAYAKFSNWDEMIASYVEERKQQITPKKKRDPKDDHSVIYNLRR